MARSYIAPVAEDDPMPTRFCDLGMRVRTMYVLSGSILTYWRFLDRSDVKLQLVRLRITPDSALPPERRGAAAEVANSSAPPFDDELNKSDYIVGALVVL